MSVRELSADLTRQTLDVVLTKRAPTTCVGVLVGGILAYSAFLLTPSFEVVGDLNLSNLRPWHWIACGVLFAHLRTVYLYAKRRPSTRDPLIAETLRLIETGDFTRAERRNHYLRLIQAVERNVLG